MGASAIFHGLRRHLAGWWWLLGPVVAVALTLPGISGPFVLDDHATIEGHPIVRGRAPLSEIACYNHLGQRLPRCRSKAQKRTSKVHQAFGPTWRPLGTIFFALQWKVFAGSALAMRIVGALGYALLTFLLGFVARSFGVGRLVVAFGAIFFAALAIHVDALVLANSTETWALVFQLLALVALLSGRPLLMVGSFVLALGFKESAAVFPALAAWLMLWRDPSHRSSTASGRGASLACLLVLLLYLLLRAQVVPLSIEGWTITADNPLLGQPLLLRWETSFALLGRYLLLTLVPLDLAADYSYAAILPGGGGLSYVIAGAIWGVGILATMALAWRHRRRHAGWRLVGFALGAFLIYFALPSNAFFLLPIIFAERLFMGPSVFLVLGLLGAQGLVAARWPRAGRMLVVTLGLVSVMEGAFFMMRTTLWAHPLRLWAAQVETQPKSVKGHLYYAHHLAAAHDPALALWHLAVAMDGRRHFPGPWRPPPTEAVRGVVSRKALLSRIPALLAPREPPLRVWRHLEALAARHLGEEAAHLVRHQIEKLTHGPWPEPRPSILER